MADDTQTEIARLTADLRRKEAEASKLEAEIADLEREMDEFRGQYERVIHPVEALLDAVNAAIEEFEEKWRAAYFADAQPLESWTEPGEYIPVEEQYRRVWGKPGSPPVEHPFADSTLLDAEDNSDSEALLKRLFRGLARRYHPDFAADDADRDYRTRLMAMINEAYAARDVGTLQTLMNQDEHV
ncbi:MAG: hypothetical protein K8I30_10145, partial [Anaerolineae bacterium]|nr:hypothetical protein [Anaerolineae bacterium]